MPFVPGFTPSGSAPLFPNSPPWPSRTNLRVSIFGLPAVTIDATPFGLCGGMAFLARDIFEAGTPQLRSRVTSSIPVALAQHVVARLVHSFDGLVTVQRWLGATQSLDHGTWIRGPGLFSNTVREARLVTADIDARALCPIGIVLVQSWGAWDVFKNHVVLVWGYDRTGNNLVLHTYDPNFPDRDDITITLDVSSLTPAKPIATNGTDMDTLPGRIRGFFRLPYAWFDPSPAYIDDAVVARVTGPPPNLAPGAAADVLVEMANRGSTTWRAADGYRLGAQNPQDNMLWGMNRVELPQSSVDPGGRAAFRFKVTAPAEPGQLAFAWRMVREHVRWFGAPTPTTSVQVG